MGSGDCRYVIDRAVGRLVRADAEAVGGPVAEAAGACSRWRWLLTRVSGVVGWDEGSFACAGYERPVESGFEVVVEPAQRVEFVQPGVPGLRPGFLVVVLDPAAVAALDRTQRVGPQQRDLLRGGRPTAQMGDVGHVDPGGDDQFQDGLAEHLFGPPIPGPGRPR